MAMGKKRDLSYCFADNINDLYFFSNIPISLLDSHEIHTHNVLQVFWGSSLYFLILVGLTSLLFWLRYHLASHTKNGELNDNTHTNSSAKNSYSAKRRHFERIPPRLLLLMGIVVFYLLTKE